MKKNKNYIIGKIIIPENYFVNMDFIRSMQYEKHIVWKNENHTSPVELFVDKIYKELNIDKQEINIDNKKNGLNNLVCNLIRGVENGRLISMRRSRGAYKMHKMYGMPHYTYTNIVGGFDKLRRLEFADMKVGYFDRTENKGKLTRIWATEKLVKTLNELSVISYTLSENISTYFNADAVNISSLNFTKIFYENPIILKDAEKIRIVYKATRKNFELKKFLVVYNDFISTHDISIPVTINNKSNYLKGSTSNSNNSSSTPLLGLSNDKFLFYKRLDCRLYRVFNNGNFEQGGRFYGADYQRLSKEMRAKILIDGEPVIEVDYSGLHGRMIYHYYEKVEYKDDPYLVKDHKSLRDAFKKMFQMCINANSKIAALNAFKKSLVEDEGGWEIKKLMNQHNVSIEWLYEKLLEKHKRIDNYFNSGVGIKLQYIDSMIAENILKHFMRKGIPCLCIHDSFIVQEKYADELEAVMQETYKNMLHFNCEFKRTGKK